MANLTLSNSFDGIWPPDAMGGGTITARSATSMTYLSDAGYTVTLTGTGFTYDAEGQPSGGTITRTTVALGALTFADYTGISVNFAQAGMRIFGFDRNDGNHQDPDPFAFHQQMMRGNDLITGSSSWDDVRGGQGNDTINTGGGGDYVGDEQGNDVMNGGADWDTLSYDEGNYQWEAFRGVNLDAATGIALDCFGFTDHFSNFERYKDSLFNDTMKGSAIDDEDWVLNRGNDLVDGRGGFDMVRYNEVDNWGAHRGVKVNLATGLAVDSWNGNDTLISVEGVEGSRFNDTLTGSARDEHFLGGAGIDVIDGAGGFDRLGFWNVGDNNLAGHGIIFDFTAASNVVDDGYGNTENALRIEAVIGSRFNDRLVGNAAMNTFWGNDGADTIIGGGGEDDLSGEWGNDRIIGGSGDNDHISGGGDNDTLSGNGGSDNFNFNWDLVDSGVDTITDFAHAVDKIWIGSWWGGGLTLQDLAANQFRSGAGVTTANSATQRVIYNTTTGDLYFDADGVGGVAAVKFAVLSNHAALTFDDIHVFV